MKMQRFALLAPFLVAAVLILPARTGGTPPGLELPHTFSSGTPALASEVNENFEAVMEGVRLLDSEFSMLATPARSSQLIRVAPEGGDYPSVVEALESLDGTEGSVLIEIFPGIYEESSVIVVPENVHLQGKGADVTVLRSTSSSTPGHALEMRNGSSVAGLTLENTALDGFAAGIGVFFNDAEVRIDEVCIQAAEGSTAVFTAVYMSGLKATITRSVLKSSGASGSALRTFGDFHVEECELEADSFGIFLVTPATVNGTLERSSVLADHPMQINGAGTQVRIHDCTIEGRTTTIQANGSEVLVSSSLVCFNVLAAANGGRIVLLQCRDENFESFEIVLE